MKHSIAILLLVCIMSIAAMPAMAKQPPKIYTLIMEWNEQTHKLNVSLLDRDGRIVQTIKPRRGSNLKDKCYVIRSIRPNTIINVPDGWMVDSDIRFSKGIDDEGEVIKAPDGSRGRRFYGGQSVMLKQSNSDITVRSPYF